jgi:hypothetical protein
MKENSYTITTSCMILVYHANNWITSALAGRPQFELVTYLLDKHLFLCYKFQREKYSLTSQTSLKDMWGIRENRHVTATWKLIRGSKSGSAHRHRRTHTHTHISDEDTSRADWRNHMECVDLGGRRIIKKNNFKGTSLMGSHKVVAILRNISKYLP